MTEDESSPNRRIGGSEQSLYLGGTSRASEPFGYTMMLEVARLIARVQSLPELFQELAPRVQTVPGCEFVSFSLHDARRNCMLTHDWIKDQGIGEPQAFALDASVNGWACRQQEAMQLP